MAAETSTGAVKAKIRALREEKAGVQESGKREILRQKIGRLKKKTRKLSREAGLQAQDAAAAAVQPAEPAAPAEQKQAAPETRANEAEGSTEVEDSSGAS